MEITNPKHFKNRDLFREWLSKNHANNSELWILFYKVHTNKKCVRYAEAVEEAICFGWIDGIVKRIDDEKHAQRFSPRKSKSIWSKVNKERAKRMVNQGKMINAGVLKIKEAKKNGWWNKAYSFQGNHEMSDEMKKVLMSDREAWKNFQSYGKSYQNTYIFWVNYAKHEETKLKRIQIVLERARKNQPPGII